MQVLRLFEMEEANVATKESKFIVICKDTLLIIETSTLEVVCIKKYCIAHEMRGIINIDVRTVFYVIH